MSIESGHLRPFSPAACGVPAGSGSDRKDRSGEGVGRQGTCCAALSDRAVMRAEGEFVLRQVGPCGEPVPLPP